MPVSELSAVTNNERFNAFINSCSHPRRVLNALRALAPATQTTTVPSSAALSGTQEQKREMFHQMLNSRKHPQRAYSLPAAIAAAHETGCVSNVEILTARLNALEHRREIFNVLQSITASLTPASTEQQKNDTSAEEKEV